VEEVNNCSRIIDELEKTKKEPTCLAYSCEEGILLFSMF